LVIRKKDRREETAYPALLRDAVFEKNPDQKQPSFYALVIK
jgi:hypothetical protein